MNIFFDTEFTGLHKDTTLISIGLIAEDGRTFYAELEDYDTTQVDNWIQENVIKHLKFNEYSSYLRVSPDGRQVEMKGNKKYVADCLGRWMEMYHTPIQMVSDVCHYDMVLFIDLFGHAFKLPQGVSASCHDINQDIAAHYNVTEAEAFDMSREGMLQMLPEGDKHNALYDAKVIREIYYHVIENSDSDDRANYR